MILLSLATLARAETICWNEAAAVAPSPGATDVPLDAAIAIVFSAESDCGGEQWDDVFLDTMGPDGWEPVFATAVAGEANDIAWIPIEGGLSADTDYRLSMYNGTSLAETSFQTGTRTTEPLAETPAAQLIATRFIGRSGRVEFETVIEAAANLYGDIIVGLVEPDEPERVVASTIASDTQVGLIGVSSSYAAKPDEACVRAVQWDSAGRLVGDGEVLCGAPTRSGCSTAPGAATAALAALSLLTMRRRR